MFWLRKLLAAATAPLGLGLGLAAAGVLLLWSGRRPRLGRSLATAGVLLLAAAAYGWPFNALTASLESRYRPLDPAALAPRQRAALRHVVVLGGGHRSDQRLPPPARLGSASLFRLAEGIRILRHFPNARLVVSGGPGFGTVSNARVVADAALALGVAPDRIHMEERPATTAEEARLLAPLLAGAPFVLVTSAAHLPRAMAVFRGRGLAPIAAPADFSVHTGPATGPGVFFPSPGNLATAAHLVHETLGACWYRLRGEINGGGPLRRPSEATSKE